jgi:formylglycine-generating enzyme required for sulfatase activity
VNAECAVPTDTTPPQLESSGECTVNGVALFTLTDKSGLLGPGEEYNVKNAAGNVVKRGTLALDSQRSVAISVAGAHGRLTLSIPRLNVTVNAECTVPTDTPVPVAMTISTVTANARWKPVERSFDGVAMMLVPPGCFMMGSDNGDSGERPVTKICFDQPFWIDKTEVTQRQFKQFGGKAANLSYFQGDNQPVEMINWFEGRDFCAKRGARLPTEAEWEYAARGPNDLTFPMLEAYPAAHRG